MNQFEQGIREESRKLIRRFEQYARRISEENERRTRRTTQAPPKLRAYRPSYWALAPGFDPYLVRARAQTISHSVRAAISAGRYHPRNPTAYTVPKADGSGRVVSVFQVADSAVSSLIFRRVLEKNRPRLSSRSYAYRPDVTVHDALQHLQAEFQSNDRLFIAEYDFSKFFDNIDHEHIWRTLSDGGFLLTKVERQVIRAILEAPTPDLEGPYQELGGIARQRGVPQGTSVSLFLANVAASPLDRELERLGVGFVRYADDTVIWSKDYGQICRAVDELYAASRRIGSELNPAKSAGVRLLVGHGVRGEIAETSSVEFVGYKASLRLLEMRDSTVNRVKSHLLDLLYYNLLHAPLRGTQDPTRLTGRVDRDYVVFIWQARRYLYGDLSEVDLRRYQAKGVPMRRFKGLMSYFPLLDDSPSLRALDAWLATQTELAMRKRARILAASGLPTPPPLQLPRQALMDYQRTSNTTGGTLDLRLPSFRRISNVVRHSARQYGPNRVGRGRSPYAY
jgi:hypothetical protein